MVISERLKALASYVRRGSKVADIGTDHGFLPIYLMREGIAACAIASDVREGPAAVARKNIRKADLSDRIAVRVGDGLAPISPDEADDIVIAGMGGETIVEILDAAPWVIDVRCRLILQPMSHAEILREWLYTHGFSTVTERLLEDVGRKYIVLVTEYTAAQPVTDAFVYWRGQLAAPEGRPYWQKTAAYLRQRADGCVARGEPDMAVHWREIAQKLEQL